MYNIYNMTIFNYIHVYTYITNVIFLSAEVVWLICLQEDQFYCLCVCVCVCVCVCGDLIVIIHSSVQSAVPGVVVSPGTDQDRVSLSLSPPLSLSLSLCLSLCLSLSSLPPSSLHLFHTLILSLTHLSLSLSFSLSLSLSSSLYFFHTLILSLTHLSLSPSLSLSLSPSLSFSPSLPLFLSLVSLYRTYIVTLNHNRHIHICTHIVRNIE